ncbi:MAG: phytanoyl-CoA dioxygenase family protein [Planctomycetota bacterium]
MAINQPTPATSSTTLTHEEIATYQRDGLIIPRYRLPWDLLGRMRESFAKLLRDNPTIRPEMLLGVHIAKGYADGMRGNPDFLEYALNPHILDLVEQVIGPNIILWGTQIICKPGGDGMAVPWHQDGEYWPIRPLATCTVWIAIEDSTPENGCMRYVPGSHKRQALLAHHHSDRDDLALNQQLDAGTFDENDAKDDALEAGQMSLHDIYLVNGSNPNRSPKRRAGFIIRYMPSTSHFDRSIHKMDRLGKADTSMTNFSTRPIWLARGVDRCGKNDFTIGHERTKA